MSDSESLVRDLLSRGERLRTDRTTFESHWQEIRDVIYPSAEAFRSSEASGSKAHARVLDSTGEQAAELLAAALHAGLTAPGLPWFSLRARDEATNRDPEAARWLE